METKLPELLLSVAALKMCQETVTSHLCVCSASHTLRNPEMSASVWPTKRPNNKERIPQPRRRENTRQKVKPVCSCKNIKSVKWKVAVTSSPPLQQHRFENLLKILLSEVFWNRNHGLKKNYTRHIHSVLSEILDSVLLYKLTWYPKRRNSLTYLLTLTQTSS